MGAENPRSFSAINKESNKERDAEFISYADVMHTLMQLRATPLQEIAEELKQRRIHKSHAAYLSGPELAVTKTKNTGALKALLDETINSKRIAPAHYGSDDEIAKPHLNGWLHREFIFAMAMAQLPWPVTPDMLAAVEERRTKQESEFESPPEWMRPYIGRNRISLGDAAALLARVDLSAPGALSNDNVGRIDSWRDALIDAIDSREIDASTWSTHEARDREQMLSHVDICTWYAKRGRKWPIPDPNPQPATNAEMAERLRVAEADRARLMRDTADLTVLANDRARLREQVDALNTKNSELSALLDAANAKAQELSGDQAAGKSRSAMLQVIGGLVLANTIMDIHAARLDGLGKLRGDLQTVGVSIGEDALRGYLKDAATLIEKPRIR